MPSDFCQGEGSTGALLAAGPGRPGWNPGPPARPHSARVAPTTGSAGSPAPETLHPPVGLEPFPPLASAPLCGAGVGDPEDGGQALSDSRRGQGTAPAAIDVASPRPSSSSARQDQPAVRVSPTPRPGLLVARRLITARIPGRGPATRPGRSRPARRRPPTLAGRPKSAPRPRRLVPSARGRLPPRRPVPGPPARGRLLAVVRFLIRGIVVPLAGIRLVRGPVLVTRLVTVRDGGRPPLGRDQARRRRPPRGEVLRPVPAVPGRTLRFFGWNGLLITILTRPVALSVHRRPQFSQISDEMSRSSPIPTISYGSHPRFDVTH